MKPTPQKKLNVVPLVLMFLFFGGCEIQRKASSTSMRDKRQIETLIQRLKDADDSAGYQIAMELGKFKGEATPLLIKGLRSTDKTTRKYCARAITNIVGGYGDDSGRHFVVDAQLPLLESLAREKDSSVAWYITQAVECTKPDGAKALPVLQKKLNSSDLDLIRLVVEAIGTYEKEAVGALSDLIDLYQRNTDDWLRDNILQAINDIGPDDASLLVITKTVVSSERTAASVLKLLVKHPSRAIDFLKLHPNGLTYFDVGHGELIENIFADDSPRNQVLREYLLSRADLPVTVRVRIGTPKQLEIVKKQIRDLKDDPHRRSFLRSCARVLGDKPIRPVVTLSEEKKGDFRPDSAHPGVNHRRQTDDAAHGDGYTMVMISGTIRLRDGTPAVNPKFFAANDRMLLGRQDKRETPLFKYDKDTGRFAYLTTVFAAYAMGKGQKEPGPYQTGSAITLIETDNSGSLVVEFFDEMPEVSIVLPEK